MDGSVQFSSVLARQHQQHRHREEEESSAVRVLLRRRHVSAADDDDDRVLGACSRRGGGGWWGRPAGGPGRAVGQRRPAGKGVRDSCSPGLTFLFGAASASSEDDGVLFAQFPLFSCTCFTHRRCATTTINKPVERATGLMLAESAPSAICSLFLLH